MLLETRLGIKTRTIGVPLVGFFQTLRDNDIETKMISPEIKKLKWFISSWNLINGNILKIQCHEVMLS